MVSIAQVQKGAANFIDREIVPKLSMMEKIIIGGGGGLVTAKLPQIMANYADHPFFSALGLYDKEHGEIDLEAVWEAVKPYVGVDPVPLKIPFVGVTLKMGQREFETLYRYIMEA